MVLYALPHVDDKANHCWNIFVLLLEVHPSTAERSEHFKERSRQEVADANGDKNIAKRFSSLYFFVLGVLPNMKHKGLPKGLNKPYPSRKLKHWLDTGIFTTVFCKYHEGRGQAATAAWTLACAALERDYVVEWCKDGKGKETRLCYLQARYW